MVEVNLNCESDIKPSKYIIENIIDGKCDIVLNDNITKNTRTDETGDLKTYYTYDIYRIVKNNYRDTLENELNENEKYEAWLELAKKTEYDKLTKEIRSQRDKLLDETDWTQMQDTSLSKEIVQKYQRYRQALRDITKQKGFPYEVEFPTLESEG